MRVSGNGEEVAREDENRRRRNEGQNGEVREREGNQGTTG